MPDQTNATVGFDPAQAVQPDSTRAKRVTEQLEQLIVERQIAPGSRLPSERELAEQFGVSRTVVREAVRSLMAKGYVEVRPGSGATVRRPTAEAVSQSMTLFLRSGHDELDYLKVHEIRRVLEVEIAGFAAARHTAEDLTQLDEIMADMEMHREDRERFARNDVAFHAALATATHNELFVLLLHSVVDIMMKVRYLGALVPHSADHALRYHRAILAQIKAKDPEGARWAMRQHLDDSEEIVRQALVHRDSAE